MNNEVKRTDNKGSNQKRSNRGYGRDERTSEFEEKVIQVDRVSRTVKGGKRMRFRALVVIGNRKGKVGAGIGKAQEVLTAVQKAVAKAKKNIIEVPIINDTIPHEVKVSYGSSEILFKPAGSGTSVIAGGSVRAVLELAGIKNVLSKIIGSSNKINNVKATLIALKSMRKRENSNQVKVEIKKEEKNEVEPNIEKNNK